MSEDYDDWSQSSINGAEAIREESLLEGAAMSAEVLYDVVDSSVSSAKDYLLE